MYRFLRHHDGHVIARRLFLRRTGMLPVDRNQELGDKREQKRFAQSDGDHVQKHEQHHESRHHASAEHHVHRGVFHLFLLPPTCM